MLEPISQMGTSHRGRRGARLARRDDGEYREYLTEEQRRQTGCIAGRMPTPFVRWVLEAHGGGTTVLRGTDSRRHVHAERAPLVRVVVVQLAGPGDGDEVRQRPPLDNHIAAEGALNPPLRRRQVAKRHARIDVV